jgi:hypothetical protein
VRLFFIRGFASFALCAMFFASNLQLPVIQAVAWVRMYQHYRVGYEPMQALAITFSGKAPCQLCQFVKKAQKEEQAMSVMYSDTQREMLPLSCAAVFIPPATARQWRLFEPVSHKESWIVSPELPPPRAAEVMA